VYDEIPSAAAETAVPAQPLVPCPQIIITSKSVRGLPLTETDWLDSFDDLGKINNHRDILRKIFRGVSKIKSHHYLTFLYYLLFA
jgi:hypothetical protein